MRNLEPLSYPVASKSFGNLSALDFRTEYRSLKENPAADFYRRCLSHSSGYKRAVGYFKSSIFLVVGSSVIDFARRGGKISLICSPQLDSEDIDSIALGYARRSERITETLIEQFEALLLDQSTAQSARVLATLISFGILEIKLAVRSDRKGLYHEKIGIFSDTVGNRVSFKGSANETWSAWHQGGNFESIEVFCSWRGGLETQRVDRHEAHFDALWSENDPDVEVFPFPSKAVDHLKKAAFKGLNDVTSENLPLPPPRRSALPHQHAAILAWINQGRRGIFEHATGSGKTFTALLAIREHVSRGLPAVILVPSRLLLEQWALELRAEIPDAALLIAGAGNDRWRIPNRLRSMTDSDTSFGARVVLATMQTASMPEFVGNVAAGEHLLIVADEVHQLGSEQNSRIMSLASGSRLGLSATPQRYGDPEGTGRIFEYFGSIVPPSVTLVDAIQAGRLVPYEYYPHPINLSEAEAVEWKEVTNSIRQEIAKQRSDENGRKQIGEKAKLLLIRRARIAKKAAAKVELAGQVLKETFERGQSWLIYCEDSDQLSKIMDVLKEKGFDPIEYHSNMTGDRDATMIWFRSFGGILVSIRCLDEGVDIPAVSHALILASSQNPRQFIQRRGRVLRRSPEKSVAAIHDAIVVPLSAEREPEQVSLLRSELLRSIEFAKNAINRDAAAELRSIAIHVGVAASDLSGEGFEDDDQD